MSWKNNRFCLCSLLRSLIVVFVFMCVVGKAKTDDSAPTLVGFNTNNDNIEDVPIPTMGFIPPENNDNAIPSTAIVPSLGPENNNVDTDSNDHDSPMPQVPASLLYVNVLDDGLMKIDRKQGHTFQDYSNKHLIRHPNQNKKKKSPSNNEDRDSKRLIKQLVTQIFIDKLMELLNEYETSRNITQLREVVNLLVDRNRLKSADKRQP